MGYSESDEEFELRLKVMAAAETHTYARNAGDEAALKRFRRRLRAHRAAERRARAVRLGAALCGLHRRIIPQAGGLRIAFVIGAILLAGAGAVLRLTSVDGRSGPNTTAQEDGRSGSKKSSSTQQITGQQSTGGRRAVIETSISGQTAIDGPGIRHSASTPPAAPPAESAPGVATTPATGTWIVKGKAIARTREIQLKAEVGQVKLTATVSARNTSVPCRWSASAGESHSEKAPSTTDPTRVAFSIHKPTKVIKLGVRHRPPAPDAEAGVCVMADIIVEGDPVSSRHPSPTALPVTPTEPGGRDEPDNQRRTGATAAPTHAESRPPAEPVPPTPSPTASP
jgi:hypothetical protein